MHLFKRAVPFGNSVWAALAEPYRAGDYTNTDNFVNY